MANPNRKRTALSDQERAQKRAADREYSLTAIEALRSSAGWKAWLSTRSSFHSHSLGNQLLIAMQHPTATHVAGFRAWLKLGYCVRKGETGIRIWAPCPPSQKQLETWRNAGAQPEQRPRTYFKLTAVFAQDQVDELPPPAQPAPLEIPGGCELEGDQLAPVLPSLIDAAQKIGSTVSFAEIPGGARGFYEISTRRIVIDNRPAINSQAATLVHELAHALVRADRRAEDPTLDYASEELVVESVAFTVLRHLGIDPDEKAIPYLAFWSENSDLSVIRDTAALIDRLASVIEGALAQTNDGDSTPQIDREIAA